MLGRWILVASVFALAIGANAAWLLHEPQAPAQPAGDVRVDLNGTAIQLPRALIRDAAQQGGGRLMRVDLAVSRIDFAPITATHRQRGEDETGDILHLSIAHAGQNPAPAEQLQQLYARFLRPETHPGPNGLTRREFRPGTPYEDKLLFIGAGPLGTAQSRLFIALCPQNPADIEPCTARLRQESLDITVRFVKQALPDWRQTGTEALALLNRAMTPEPTLAP
jgi:hypothetical protein